MNDHAEILLDAKAFLAEGPVWDDSTGRLMWVDIMAGAVHATSTDGRDEIVWEAGTAVGCIAALGENRWMVAERDRLSIVTNWNEREEVALLPIDEDVRTNDGKLDPAGRLVVGTLQDDAADGRGSLFSWDGDSLSVLIKSVSISNGLAWDAAGTTMYYIDTPTLEIVAYCYDLATGKISGRRVHVSIDPSNGSPDGMTIDSEGALWVALWGGGCVHRYLRDGTLDRVITVDATNVSSCAFNADESRLFITSALQDAPGNPGDGAIHVYSRR